MSDHRSNVDVQMGTERNFGLVFAVVFALIALLPLFGGQAPRSVVLAIAAIFAALAFMAPQVLRTPNRLWFKLGMLLGAIVAPIVMGLIYLLAFVPMGVILRLMGKDLLDQNMEPDRDSYWIARNEPPKPMKLQY
ncbi:hypothetical protein SAMN05421538_101406 [Paracoccus isoporae]|uniref:SxtJ n=1 Tax=Paracoccus isoporae TaxID=591205 RepID=A0A1G6TXX2_9RHOB|nr:SxtJ family membrane protein [Paracoccus isoporae]SDD33950.1 hypothetical protein SAMN05421538_101406 [Paracoccus isoporae]